jgi:hypothetical protein
MRQAGGWKDSVLRGRSLKAPIPGLTAGGNVVACRVMKTKLLVALFAGLLATAGCVDTVTGGKTAGVPFIKDTVEGRYKAPPDVIFAAAKEVMKEDGVLTDEGIHHGTTNEAKVVQGRVNECTVWVRIAPMDSQVTSVEVQTRTNAGGSDMALAHQIDKEIAVRLASGPRR